MALHSYQITDSSLQLHLRKRAHSLLMLLRTIWLFDCRLQHSWSGKLNLEQVVRSKNCHRRRLPLRGYCPRQDSLPKLSGHIWFLRSLCMKYQPPIVLNYQCPKQHSEELMKFQIKSVQCRLLQSLLFMMLWTNLRLFAAAYDGKNDQGLF